MKIKLFLVVCLVYELTSLRVYKLFVAIMVCVVCLVYEFTSLRVYKFTSSRVICCDNGSCNLRNS